MNEQLKKYSIFVGSIMAKEYANTMEKIRSEFTILEDIVSDMLEHSNEQKIEDTLDTIGDMVKHFGASIDKMIEGRLKKITSNKRTIFVEKIAELCMECDSTIELMKLIPALMSATECAFESYSEMCATYVCDRIHALMNTVESKLGIREEIEELENLFDVEELDILELLKVLQKIK